MGKEINKIDGAYSSILDEIDKLPKGSTGEAVRISSVIFSKSPDEAAPTKGKEPPGTKSMVKHGTWECEEDPVTGKLTCTKPVPWA